MLRPFSLMMILMMTVCNAQTLSYQLPIRLNTVGYLPDAPKIATIQSTSQGASFTVVNAENQEAVFTGSLEKQKFEGQMLAFADFSSFRTPGSYQVLAGEHASAVFQISEDLYEFPFRTAVRAMYLWRCGIAVEGEHNGDIFRHAACHLEDGFMDFVTGETNQHRCGTGGWHDAGDYNKYVTNAAITVFSMLRAWEEFQPEIEQIILDLPEKGGPIPEFLAEVKWKLDWLLKMQEPDGRVLHKISTTHFGGFINPEDEKTPRYFVPWGTTATADFVGMLAMASRILAPFDEAYAQRCLAAAQLSYDYLVAHPDYVPANQEAFHTGRYESDDSDDRLWAAAELWATSGDARVLKDLEERIRNDSAFDVDFDWGNVKTPGLITYLFSDRDGRDPELVALLKHNLIQSADLIVAHADNHPYARPLERYYWGCNGTVVRLAHVLQSAWRLEPKMDYQRVTLDAVNHVFGRNVHGRSYVTGLGAHPPLQPHDRRISEDGVDAPWPGYLVGGPHPRAEDWVDEIGDYRTNEIAINWNGALIYALAASLR